MRKFLLASLIIISFSIPTSTQIGTVVNPSTVTFAASPDHDVMIDTTPVVSNYVLEVYEGATLRRSTSLGKPTPVGGDITVSLVRDGLNANKLYNAHILTQGAGGETRSVTPSNPFAWLDAPAAASNIRVK